MRSRPGRAKAADDPSGVAGSKLAKSILGIATGQAGPRSSLCPEVMSGVQGLTTGVIFQTDPLPPLDFWNIKGTMFLLCSKVGAKNVEDLRGRSCGAGVDHAFRRDGRGLGPTDPSALRPSPRRQRAGGKRGRVGLSEGSTWTPLPQGITIERRVGLPRHSHPLKPQ